MKKTKECAACKYSEFCEINYIICRDCQEMSNFKYEEEEVDGNF